MQNKLQNYAKLIVKVGINIIEGQPLFISSPIECSDFARRISEEAFKAGAGDVYINYGDELFNKLRLELAPNEAFESLPDWQKDMYSDFIERGAGFVAISASDPELLKDIDPTRVAKASKVRREGLKHYYAAAMGNQVAWCVVSIPTIAWAVRVYPTLSEEEAVAKLWESILYAARTDGDDPVQAWFDHTAMLKGRMKKLNEYHFDALHYYNNQGTDLHVALPELHMWQCGGERTVAGREFIANMPTEEVFTLPDRNGVEGTLVSTLPLNYNGNLIDAFRLRFEKGKVVEYSAEVGQESLDELFKTDEGSMYLGEVALVPYDSPISNMKTLFYNTLFDENASCHFAFGKAYPTCIEGGSDMTIEQLLEAGANDSLTHEDFMVGSEDLSIDGITASGEVVPVFRNGNFVE